MDKNSIWANPEAVLFILRCTTQKYAKSFLEKGEIKFGTPESWVNYAFEKGDGRGDKLEGTLATCNIFDVGHLKKLNKKYQKYPDLIRMSIEDRVYLKKETDMKLPCFCFYVLNQNMFECPKKEGNQKLATIIPPSYFRDFIDNMSPSEIEKLSDDDKPAVIAIFDYKEFERRVINALLNIGLKRNEILIERVLYVDFNMYGSEGWWDFNQKSPIEIGSLADIAKVNNKYLYEGIYVELDAYVERLIE